MNKKLQLSNCSQCGKIFIRKNKDICPSCSGLDHTILEIMLLYLKQYPNASLDDLVLETGMPEQSILRLLKEGKFAAYQNLVLSCRICGRPVKVASRRMICQHCFAELLNERSSDKKIQDLRSKINRKDTMEVENKIKQRALERANSKKYGFTSSSEDLKSQKTFAREVEALPDVEKTYKLRLGNKFQSSLSPIFV